MFKAIVLVLLFALIGFAAVKVTLAVLMLTALLVGFVVDKIVVPLVLGLAWLVGGVVLLPFKILALLFGFRGGDRPRPLPPALGSACGNRVCRCANPAGARFCRRCGIVLA